jgi:2-polyprenyl-3-methyl-5-hydroxy-6-metoxy-1,4-benzoquinol methylase
LAETDLSIEMSNKINLISTDILKEHRALSAELLSMNRTLALSSGWHYAMDWIWVISHIDNIANKRILDAGAGIGLLQWYLSSKGAHVISVDRSDRSCIPFHLLENFNVSGYKPRDEPLSFKEILNIINRKAKPGSRVKTLIRGFIGQFRASKNKVKGIGSVQIYNQDLRDLSEIPDDSIDIIVSISALEHNEDIDVIKDIIQELERKLVPGGAMLITLPAASREDWFFSPANSWCFSEATLRRLFTFSEDIPSNFDDYDTLFEKLRNSGELRKNISWRYLFRANSGMPWGKWNPKYLPVGILKTKQVRD